MSQHIYTNFFDHIRDNITVSEIVRQKTNLTKRGQEYLGLCPFHSEKTPSFTVNDVKKFYHCFGCGAHGDVIKFLCETQGFSYIEAAKKLAEDHGVPIPQQNAAEKQFYEATENILQALNLANQFFIKNMTQEAVSYLNNRGLSKDTIEKYSIGFSSTGKGFQKYLESNNIPLSLMYDAGLIGKGEDGNSYPIFRNRIIFPIKNIYGKIIAFGGRILGDAMPKYLNSPESLIFKKSETLYGEDIATGPAYQKKYIIIVEGYMDVIAMHNVGFLETVATLGTAVTKEHLNKLWRITDELIFCLDGDSAGQKAMKKAIILLLPLLTGPRKASFLILPQTLDPDEAANKYGKKYIDDLLSRRLPTSEMIWHLETNGKNFTTPESKSNLDSTLQQYIDLLGANSLAPHMKRDFKNKIWNLSKKKKNISQIQPLSEISNLKDIKNTIEVIEYNICSLILRQPTLLSDEKIYDKFIQFEFKNVSLTGLQSFIVELFSDNEALSSELIKQNMQKSRFFDLFILLSSSDTPFLDMLSFNDSKINHNLLWLLLIKKHELELLKEEYIKVAESIQLDKFEKAKAYLDEINKVESAIKELSESLIS